jgi:hypothetical protein
MNQAVLQLAQAPKTLPIPGISPNPNFPHFQTYQLSDSFTGIGAFVANGQTCKVPAITNFGKLNIFFQACPPDKFMNPANPACTCSALRELVDDQALVSLKLGSYFFNYYGSGTVYPAMALLVAATVMTIVCVPFVYYFSLRMSTRELREIRKGRQFFLAWHQQRQSSAIGLVLICFGFILVLMGITGTAEVDVFGLFKMTTSYPGLISLILGFLTWRMILIRPPAIPSEENTHAKA